MSQFFYKLLGVMLNALALDRPGLRLWLLQENMEIDLNQILGMTSCGSKN